jgi:hypothetical protein
VKEEERKTQSKKKDSDSTICPRRAGLEIIFYKDFGTFAGILNTAQATRITFRHSYSYFFFTFIFPSTLSIRATTTTMITTKDQ